MLTIGDFNSFWFFLGHPVQVSLNSKSKSGLEKMKTILISPVLTSREGIFNSSARY